MYDFDKILERQGTASVKWDMRKQIFGNEDVLPMWVADMDFETPPFISEAVQKRAAHPLYGYSFNEDQYYDSFISWCKRRFGWEIEKEWIQYSPGIVTAVNACIKAYTNEGDGVIVQPPVYFPFFSAVKNNKRKQLSNQLLYIDHTYKIDFDDLKTKAIEAELILLSSPHNPVCRCWTKKELIELGEICHKNNVIIISDEIHADLILPGYKHIPLASISEELSQITVTCMAPSKTFNVAGFFTSSVIIKNEDLRNRFKKLMESMSLVHANIFGMTASQAAYAHGDQWLDELMIYIEGNFNLVESFLINELPSIKLVKAESTYLAWLDFNALNIYDKQLHDKIINYAGLGLSPGTVFGEGGSGFMRMNLGTSRAIVSKALNNLKSVFLT